MFDTKKQSIPQCFHDKVLLDKRWDHLRKHPVISFKLIKRVKYLRDTARLRCIENVAKKIGTDGKAG